jgi:hypothetical protein
MRKNWIPVEPRSRNFHQTRREGPMKNWTEDMRADVALTPKAIELGWTPVPHQNGSLTFEREKGNNRQTIWLCGRSYPTVMTYWHVAEIIDGRYTNHRAYMLLEDALENEGTQSIDA